MSPPKPRRKNIAILAWAGQAAPIQEQVGLRPDSNSLTESIVAKRARAFRQDVSPGRHVFRVIEVVRLVETQVLELAVEGRAADVQAARHLGHLAAIVGDGEAD